MISGEYVFLGTHMAARPSICLPLFGITLNKIYFKNTIIFFNLQSDYVFNAHFLAFVFELVLEIPPKWW